LISLLENPLRHKRKDNIVKCRDDYFQGWRLNGQLKEYMNGSHTPEEREDDPRLDGKMT
jgi:hypothetical protein